MARRADRLVGSGVIGSALVLAGGLVVSVLPWSTPLAAAPVLGALRGSLSGRMAGTVVVAAGLVLLGSAWWRLLAATRAPTGSDPAVEPGPSPQERLRRVRTAAIAWSLPLLVAPPLFSRDAWSYAAQGELTHLGLSPYVWTPSILDGQIREAVDPLWMRSPTPYGPLPLAWGSFLAGLSDNPWLLVIGHRLLAVLGLVLLAWAVPRLAARGGADPARASALVLACPLMLAHGIGGAHNDVVVAGLMAAALAVALRRPWVLGAVLAGAAAAVKVPGGLVGLGVALVSLPALVSLGPRLRRLTATGAVAVGVLLLAGAWVGVGAGWVHALGTPGTVRTPLSLTTWVGGALEGFGVPHALSCLRAAGVVAAVATAVWVAIRGRTGDPAAAVRAVAVVTTALVVLSPATHAWYFLWCLPFLAACARGPVADGILGDALLVLGVVPLESSVHGVSVTLLACVGLALLTAARLVAARAGRADGRPGAGRWDSTDPTPGLPRTEEADH